MGGVVQVNLALQVGACSLDFLPAVEQDGEGVRAVVTACRCAPT